MNDKPSRNEEEYFARQEADRIKALREAGERERAAAERRSHFMRCPKCGAGLAHEALHGIEVDRCPDCEGVWFDKGETEQLLAHADSGGVSKVFHAIFRGVKAKHAEDK